MLLKAHRSPAMVKVYPTNHPASVARFAPGDDAALRSAHYDAIFRYHGIPRTSRILQVMAVLISAALHAGLILGFNHPTAAKKVAMVKEEPAELLIMPDLTEPDEVKIQELNNDEPVTPTVQVPMLQDVPLNLPVDSSFIQLIDPTVPMKLEGAGNVMAIPLNIQHGRPDMSGMKDLFNIADLDRRPEPIVQTPPVFPYELRQAIANGRVRIGFIVTSRGEVIMPYIITASHVGFERTTLEAVVKWKFRPGQKAGRKVNTRVEQPIDFTVVDQ